MRWIRDRLVRLDGWSAAGLYLVLTLGMTWPVAAGLSTRLPNDLGDPLFTCWTLAWNLARLFPLVEGHPGAMAGYWNAGIFHPEPLALAYSDHLFPLALQVLPIWAVTRNIVLCYNLLFLSTFVLSGLGVFLLVRDLTGRPGPAFVAGLCYAFTPYRFSQLGHIQVLSSHWMPFVLFGLHRFFCSRSALARPGESAGSLPGRSGWLPLSGAATALVAQMLSCGYWLVYFPPFAAAYAVWEIARRRLWRDRRMWLGLGTASAAATAVCLPFLSAYAAVRRAGFAPRLLDELQSFSADTLAYLRAYDGLHLWPGGFTDFAREEGHLFPGVVPLMLATVGLAWLAWRLRQRVLSAPPLRGWRLAIAIPVALVGVAALELSRFELFAGRHIWRVRDTAPWLSDIRHVLLVAAATFATLVGLSARLRAATRLALGSRRVLFTTLALSAAWLSFGPHVTTANHGIAPYTAYYWLFTHVPGFDGLRVPARLGMLVMLFLAVLAGFGAAAIAPAAGTPGAGRLRVARSWLLAGMAAFFLLESTAVPIDSLEIAWKRRDERGTVSARDMAPVYDYLRRMPAGTVIAELPFGGIEAETRAVFLSIAHGHPIVNGYSGGFPARYEARKALLQDPLGFDGRAWGALVDAGTTCVVVHGWAYGGGGPIGAWLEAHGARPLATFNTDRLYQMPVE